MWSENVKAKEILPPQKKVMIIINKIKFQLDISVRQKKLNE